MITERNLLNGRIEPEEKLKLTETLSTLIEEGPLAVIRRIDKISDAMMFVHRAPAMAGYNRVQRDLVEKLYLLKKIRHLILIESEMSGEERLQVFGGDELYIRLQKALYNLVVPEWRTPLHRGVDVSKISNMYEDKLKAFLS